MNIVFFTLIIFVLLYLILSLFIKTNSKKITKLIRFLLIISFLVLAFIMIYVGRFLFSLPFVVMMLSLIKTKAGLSLIQLFRIWSLLRILRNSGRFKFGKSKNNFQSSSAMSLSEAYQILNLNFNKKYNKKEISDAHKKIISKVHPDISPETAKLASIVNEARDIIINNLNYN